MMEQPGEPPLRALALIILVTMSACSWFGSRKPQAPDPNEIIVTGAPPGSTVFVDGKQVGQVMTLNVHPQVIEVSPGDHKVEIHSGDTIVYREDTYVAAGEQRAVRVLSGSSR